MNEFFKDKRILLTGGAGSVGCALTRRILKFKPQTIRVMDVSENQLFHAMNQFKADDHLRFLIGDIRDRNRLAVAMEGIDIVFHLAAMKHVGTCEYNSFEAVKTNIDGLQNVIDAARANDVAQVIFSSTDKAARPLGVMGITKLLGEKLMASANYYRGSRRTRYTSVRFGNVVGSSGSVIPIFRRQIATGGPVTVTDKAMTRFVIQMDEAVELIFSAVRLAKGGETFVWKMRTLTVNDLADAMIAKYGKGKRIRKVFVGKRDSEKIHEEIMAVEELEYSVEMDNLYVIFPAFNYLHLVEKYSFAKPPRNAIIASNMGKHMNNREILQLLENIDREKSHAS